MSEGERLIERFFQLTYKHEDAVAEFFNGFSFWHARTG